MPDAAAVTLPELLEHHPRVLAQLITGMGCKGLDPSVEVLLSLSTEQLGALPKVGRKSVSVIKAQLKEHGLRLADPLTPGEDPRTKQVTDLWADVHRETFPGQPIAWDSPYHRDRERAQRIADVAQGHGRDRVDFGDALGRVRVAFVAYLGQLQASQNWPHEPTLGGFAAKLTARFTGSAAPQKTSRRARGAMSAGYGHLEDILKATPSDDEGWGAQDGAQASLRPLAAANA